MEQDGRKFEILNEQWRKKPSRGGTEIKVPVWFRVRCVSCENIWTARKKRGEGHFLDHLTGEIVTTCPNCGVKGSLKG